MAKEVEDKARRDRREACWSKSLNLQCECECSMCVFVCVSVVCYLRLVFRWHIEHFVLSPFRRSACKYELRKEENE